MQPSKAGEPAMMHRILLGSGTYFDYERPEESAITIEDIAYGLAFACRFGGQCREPKSGKRVFYSVAQHCVLMSLAVPPEHALEALMHEAGEATCGDVPGPLKALCPDFKKIEKHCEAAACARFGVSPSDGSKDLIKRFDLRMLATERRDLMPWDCQPWSALDGIEPLPGPITPWSAEDAAQAFLVRFAELSTRRP